MYALNQVYVHPVLRDFLLRVILGTPYLFIVRQPFENRILLTADLYSVATPISNRMTGSVYAKSMFNFATVAQLAAVAQPAAVAQLAVVAQYTAVAQLAAVAQYTAVAQPAIVAQPAAVAYPNVAY